MASDSSKKLLEKVTAAQYSLLRSLTDEETLDARWLENAVESIVKDRFTLARGFIKAARTLVRSSDPMVRRSATSRAYYGAYHAARATFFAIKRHDQDDHDKLGKEIESIVGSGHSIVDTLKDLRQRRNESDYSPYPGLGAQPYGPKEYEGIVRESVQRAVELVRLFEKFLKERRRQ